MARIDADTSIDSLKRTNKTTINAQIARTPVSTLALLVQSKAYNKEIQPQNQTVSTDVTILCSSWDLTSIHKTQVQVLAESCVQS